MLEEQENIGELNPMIISDDTLESDHLVNISEDNEMTINDHEKKRKASMTDIKKDEKPVCLSYTL